MTDTKDLLTQASAELDAERLAQALALHEAEASIDSLIQQANGLRGQIADLQEQLAAIDPWAGVDKTGATDVTDLVQARITAGYDMPAGRYLIDPTKTLKVTRDWKMDPNAVLMDMPSPSPRDCCIDIAGNGLSVTIGQVVGDRMSGAYTVGSTNEWGYGVKVSGDNCKVYNAHVSRCTGDGFGIIGKNCELYDCVSTENRRQGASVFNADGFKAYRCTLTNTGALTVDGKTDAAAPNGPCAGIDFEPDASPTGQPPPNVNAYLEDCVITGNRAGVLAWLRLEVGGSLNITMKNCTTGGNANGINAKALAGSIKLTVTGGKSVSDRSSVARIETGSALDISGVAVTGLSAKYALQALNGGVIRQSGLSYA